MPKSSFVLYLDYRKHLDLIQDDSDFRRLIEAIFAYCEYGEEPSNLSPIATMAFSFIRANLDRDNIKYESVKEKRKESGRLGGIARASKAKQNVANEANANFAKQNVANEAVNATATATGTATATATATDTVKYNTPYTPQGDSVSKEEYSDEFEIFWREYPNKNSGKKKAYSSFKTAMKKTTMAELMRSLDAHKRSSQWTKDDGKFIPHATTWLNGERWTVELEPEYKPSDRWRGAI